MGFDAGGRESFRFGGAACAVGGDGGHLLWTLPEAQAGERIPQEVVWDLLEETLWAFRRKAGRLPSRVLLLRDGRVPQDEFALALEALAREGIAYDLVSVRKSGGGRVYPVQGRLADGLYVPLEDKTFLLLTVHRDFRGTPRPLKLVHEAGDTPLGGPGPPDFPSDPPLPGERFRLPPASRSPSPGRPPGEGGGPVGDPSPQGGGPGKALLRLVPKRGGTRERPRSGRVGPGSLPRTKPRGERIRPSRVTGLLSPDLPLTCASYFELGGEKHEAKGHPERWPGCGGPGPPAPGPYPGGSAEPAFLGEALPQPDRLRLRRVFLGGLRHRPGLRPEEAGPGSRPGAPPRPLPQRAHQHLQPHQLRHRVQRRGERLLLRGEDGERGSSPSTPTGPPSSPSSPRPRKRGRPWGS